MTSTVSTPARLAAVAALVAAAVPAFADSQSAGPSAGPSAGSSSSTAQSVCSAKTKGPYGFQCHGFANVGADMEAVTFVGTVAGSNIGIFDGYGTFNSSLGSFRQHVMGPANFSDRTCAGHVTYRVWIALPNGDGPELPMLDIDFVTVNGGFEILGTPNATAGVTGAGVPRLTCRLVRTQGQD